MTEQESHPERPNLPASGNARSQSNSLRSLLARWLDFLYPPSCILCRVPLQKGRYLCQSCCEDLPRIEQPYCMKCGENIEGLVPEDAPREKVLERRRAGAVVSHARARVRGRQDAQGDVRRVRRAYRVAHVTLEGHGPREGLGRLRITHVSSPCVRRERGEPARADGRRVLVVRVQGE